MTILVSRSSSISNPRRADLTLSGIGALATAAHNHPRRCAALHRSRGPLLYLPDHRTAQAFSPPVGVSYSLSSRCPHSGLSRKKELGDPHPVTISLSLALVAATNNSDRSRSSWSAKAAGSSARDATRNGMVWALIPASSMTGNSKPLTRCMVANRMPLSGFSRPRSRIW